MAPRRKAATTAKPEALKSDILNLLRSNIDLASRVGGVAAVDVYQKGDSPGPVNQYTKGDSPKFGIEQIINPATKLGKVAGAAKRTTRGGGG
jgi:hypothetical protein